MVTHHILHLYCVSILLSAYDNRKSVCRRTRLLQMPKVHSKAFVDNRKSMLMTIRSVFQRMRFLQLYTQMRSSTTGSRAFFTCIFFKEWKQFYSPPFPESQLNYPLNRSYRCQEKFNDCHDSWLMVHDVPEAISNKVKYLNYFTVVKQDILYVYASKLSYALKTNFRYKNEWPDTFVEMHPQVFDWWLVCSQWLSYSSWCQRFFIRHQQGLMHYIFWMLL